MALKDWKKTENGKWSVVYKNKKNVEDYVTLEYVNEKNRLLWKVRTLKVRNEYFKTKSQALKYAKAYMRKN